MTYPNANLKAATVAIVGSGLAFALASIGVKSMVDRIDPIEVFFFRNATAFFLLLLLTAATTKRYFTPARHSLHWPVLIRSLLVAASILCLYQSFKGLSVATATAIYFTFIPAACIVTIVAKKRTASFGAAMLLCLTSFSGALLIIQPQALAEPVALLYAVLSAIFATTSLLLLARVSRTTPAETISLYMFAIGALVMAPALPFVWTTPTPADLATMAAIGLLGIINQILLTRSIHLTSSLYISPFIYISVAFSSIVDHFIWNYQINKTNILGITIVFSSSIYMFLNEKAYTKQSHA